MTQPEGNPVIIATFVDADHNHYIKPRWYVTGSLLLLNKK